MDKETEGLIRGSMADFVLEERLKSGMRPEVTPSRKAAKYIHMNSKKRASLKGIKYELTAAKIEKMIKSADYRCTVTRIEFDFGPSDGNHRRPWFPSLDRIDSAKAYTEDNCRIVCIAANTAMNEWGEAALIRMAKGILGDR